MRLRLAKPPKTHGLRCGGDLVGGLSRWVTAVGAHVLWRTRLVASPALADGPGLLAIPISHHALYVDPLHLYGIPTLHM